MTGKKIFLIFLCIYLFFMGGHIGGDSILTYLTTKSVVLDGNLVLNDHPERGFGITEVEEVYNRVITSEEKVYTRYQFGEVLLQIPLFIIGYIVSLLYTGVHADYIIMFFVSMLNCFITSLLCMVFFKILGLFSIKHRTLIVIALGFSTPLFFYSAQGFRAPIIGLCVLIGVYYVILHYRYSLNKYLFYSGFAIGFAVFTRLDSVYIPMLIFFFILIFSEVSKISKTVKSLLYFITPVFFFVILNSIIYLFTTTTVNNYGESTIVNFNPVIILENIYGILLSSGKSIFLYAPIIILFFFTFRRFMSSYKYEGLLLITLIVGNILFYSLFRSIPLTVWAWGARFQYAIIPLLLIPIGYGLGKNRIIKLLIITGILIQLPSILVNPAMVQKEIRNKFLEKDNNPILEYTTTVDTLQPISKQKGIIRFLARNDSLTTITFAHRKWDSTKKSDYWDELAITWDNLPSSNIAPLDKAGFIAKNCVNFIPKYSPVLWGYYQIASAVKTSFGGESLEVNSISFKDIDFWDIWFINIYRKIKEKNNE